MDLSPLFDSTSAPPRFLISARCCDRCSRHAITRYVFRTYFPPLLLSWLSGYEISEAP